MKGREGKGPPPSTDLLVCFPSRSHLTLMPKPICSPARPSDSIKHHHHHHHHLKKLPSNRNRQGSPLLWAKTYNKSMSKDKDKDISEPTSPKVTCAGQVKIRSKPASSCKNWQSVMEEIERLHNNKRKKSNKKKPAWIEALRFKKDVMQFLTCLRNIKFDFRCFGSFPSTSGITSDEDDEEDDDDQQPRISRGEVSDENNESTIFSKWFMVLQENNNNSMLNKENNIIKNNNVQEPCAPPPNALLLMRCRSAPPKSWLQGREEEVEKKEDEKEKEKKAMEEEEEEKKRKENLVVMRCGTDFYKFSSDIAKETWVFGGVKDQLSRNRSWKQ